MTAVFLLGSWSLVFYVSQLLRQDMQQLLGDQQYAAVSLLATQLDEEFNGRLAALKTVAAYIDATLMARPAALEAMLEKRPVFYGLFNGGALVVWRDGTTLADVPQVPGRVGTNYLDREHVAAALRDGKAGIGRPTMGKVLQAPVISMAVPIRDTHGQVIGALLGAINLGTSSFIDTVTAASTGMSGGYLIVAPQYRMVITALTRKVI